MMRNAEGNMRTPETVHCWARTLVLVGKTGNGKSATGNTIIGRKVFDSRNCSAGVTSTCKLETAELNDGHIINVIDTPGLYDPSVKLHVIANEIAKCIDLAKDGIHALLLVLSIRNRFSPEEASAFEGLRQIFGPKIVDRMIVVFTNGDALEENECLDGFVLDSELLRSTVEMCGRRRVLFDNRTNDAGKKVRQQKELLSLVNEVVDNNGGMPYTNDLFNELKMVSEVKSHQGLHEDRFERFVGMVELRMRERENILRLERQVAEEKAARLEAEAALEESKAEMLDLEDRLKKLEQELIKEKDQNSQKTRNKSKEEAKEEGGSCVIL